MIDLKKFTYPEIIEMILRFHTSTCCYWDDELDQYPAVKRFVDMDYAQKDEEREGVIVISDSGKNFLHECIKEISESFIRMMEKKCYELTYDEVAKWFTSQYGLESTKDGEEIAEYICRNLYHYGYVAYNCYSSQKGSLYRLEEK